MVARQDRSDEGKLVMGADKVQGSIGQTLLLETFFTGRSKGLGTTLSRGGTVSNQFVIDAVGEWNDSASTLHLTEFYEFDDGHKDILKWRIQKLKSGQYEGNEPRVQGVAKGVQGINHFRWSYRRDTPQKNNKTYRLGFVDDFVLMTPKLLVTTATVTWFGIQTANLIVAYEKK